MSGLLGIGVKVYIGWTTSDRINPEAYDVRLKVGTITKGPFLRGSKLKDRHGLPRNKTGWVVQVAGCGEVMVSEHLLHPIDDDDAKTERERIENPERAEA